MKSFSTVKSELQLKNRSQAEAEQHGFPHFLLSNSLHDLIPSGHPFGHTLMDPDQPLWN